MKLSAAILGLVLVLFNLLWLGENCWAQCDSLAVAKSPLYDALVSKSRGSVTVGDTELIGTWIYQDCCGNATNLYSTCDVVDSNLQSFDFKNNVIYFHPTIAGPSAASKTVYFTVLPNGHKPQDSTVRNVIRIANLGMSDSAILIRPKVWTMRMRPDLVHGGWIGASTPVVSNNVSIRSEFSQFSLVADSSARLLLSIALDSIPTNDFYLNAFSSRRPLSLIVRSPRGSYLSGKTLDAVFTLRVRNRDIDSIYSQQVKLIFDVVPHKITLDLTPAALSFKPIAGIPETQYSTLLHLKGYDSVVAAKAPYPFSASAQRLSDSVAKITVICDPDASGEYHCSEPISCYYTDFSNEQGIDLVSLYLSGSVDASRDTAYWVPTSSETGGGVSHLVLLQDATVFCSCPSVFRSRDSGSTWQLVHSAEHSSQLEVDGTGALYELNEPTVDASVDEGETWVTTYLHGSVQGVSDRYCDPLGIATSQARYVSVAAAGTYRSSPTFGRIYPLFISKDGGHQWSDDVGYSYAYPNRWDYLMSSGSEFAKARGTYFTQYFPTPELHANSDITCFTRDSLGDLLVGTTADGVYLLKLGSQSWTRSSLAGHVTQITSTRRNGIFAATLGNGVYISTDTGSSWHGINGGLTTKFINCVAARDGDYVYIGTQASGVYRSAKRLEKRETSTVPSVRLSETSLSALTNYPNPFSTATTLRYQLKSASAVRIDVVDELGRTVRTIDEGHQTTGEHQIELSASGLRSGVYWLILAAGSAIVRRSIFVLP